MSPTATFALEQKAGKHARDGMGGHHSAHNDTDEWLTPRHVLVALGAPEIFDLDPCAALSFPERCALRGFTVKDNGWMREWFGRVWLNPPYGRDVGAWLKRLADHGNGIALVFARTETEQFHRQVWERASAVLFLEGRLTFLRSNGIPALRNAGAPSCLIAYGATNLRLLELVQLPGKLVKLKGETDGKETQGQEAPRAEAGAVLT